MKPKPLLNVICYPGEWDNVEMNCPVALETAKKEKLKCHWKGKKICITSFGKKAEWNDNHLIFETYSKGLLMKDLLVSSRPSYQHQLMKLSRALLRHSTFCFFFFFAESEKVKRCWHFPVPSLPLPWVGCWIRTNWRRHFGPCQSLTSSPPLVLSPAMSLSHSLPLLFLSCSPLSKKKKKKEKRVHTKRKLSVPPYHTWPHLLWSIHCITHLSPAAL